MKSTLQKLHAATASLGIALTTFACGAARAEVPIVDGIGDPAIVICKVLPNGMAVKAVHMDKIIFRITDFLVAAAAADQPQLNDIPRNTPHDIKVLDDPKTVADLKAKVLTFLGALVTPANRNAITVIDVDYAVVCPNPTGPGG
jgi:hypothetical protein